MNNEGELDIAYDISCNEDLSVLSVFKTENGQIKMIKAFIGEKAENMYKLLTEKGGEYEQRPHGEWTKESAIDYLTEIGWLPEHDRILTERPHGEWIEKYYSIDVVGVSHFKCSKCWKEITTNGKPYNFCPNCGADMRKEGDSDA